MLSSMDRAFVAREARCPLWAAMAPVVYLAACALAARAVVGDPTAEVGIWGVVAAIGLVPAFAIPVVFASCKVTIGVADGALSIDGRAHKLDDIRVERAARGAAKLHVVLRSGQERSFAFESYADANAILLALPPISAPAGALAA